MTLADHEAVVLAVAHHAGGVGKTTTVINLGDALARQGKRVLLVDMDAQADLSSRLGLEPANPSLITSLIDGSRPQPVYKTYDGAQIAVLPSSLDMAAVELRLVPESRREKRLQKALRELMRHFDYILIDCPPSLSMLTVNALYAADGVIITVQAQDKAYNALHLVVDTINDVAEQRHDDNPDDGFGLFGIVVTMLDKRVAMGNEIVRRLRDEYGPVVFESVIPNRTAAQQDSRHQAPIAAYAPADATTAAYMRLAEEVISRAETPALT